MAKRIPRKKRQRRNSPSHSDLYTDENPKGTIKGLKFATVKDAEASVNKIKKSGRSHNHKTQAAIAMEQRAKAAGKPSAAAVYRKFIEQQKKKTAAKNEGIANKKNLYLDVPNKSRGYMSGLDVTWEGEDAQTHIYNWYKQMHLAEVELRKYIRQILLEEANFKLKGSEDYFRVDLPGIGYAQGPLVLQFQECQADVDALMQTPEYIEAEKRFQAKAKPRTDIVRNKETGKYEEVEVGPAKFRPRFYEVENAWITNPENRGKGHGKEIYKAFIDQAKQYSQRYGGVFIGSHKCVIGTGTSEDAGRVWDSLGREYTSSGQVIFIGL